MKSRTFAAGLALALWAVVGSTGFAVTGQQILVHTRLDGLEQVFTPPPHVILVDWFL